MLRPEMVVTYARARAEKKQTDFLQLMDGINVGGRIIVGGGFSNSASLLTIMRNQKKLGMVFSVAEIKEPLSLEHTYTFDGMAIAQMIMIAKNEAFHQTVDQCLNMLQQVCTTEGHSIETGLQALREIADEVGHL